MTGLELRDRTDPVFETADGCRIAYALHGRPGAPKIALIHSLALDGSFWDRVVEAVGTHAEILTFDCRGHGRSSPASGPYTTELLAGDLAQLLAHLGWTSIHLAGCSMGGCVSQAFAAGYGDRLASLCLIDTTAWYGPDAPEQWRMRAGRAREEGLSSLIGFQIERWFSLEFRNDNPALVQRLKDVFIANDVDCYQASCEMLGDADLRAAVTGLAVPTAIIVGEGDHATPVGMAEWLHEAIPNSTLTVIPDCRHLSPIERPDVIAAQLLHFARSPQG